MKYKNFEACVEFDAEAHLFHGEVLGLHDVITFQAECEEDLEREFHASLDEYIKYCAEIGKTPDLQS